MLTGTITVESTLSTTVYYHKKWSYWKRLVSSSLVMLNLMCRIASPRMPHCTSLCQSDRTWKQPPYCSLLQLLQLKNLRRDDKIISWRTAGSQHLIWLYWPVCFIIWIHVYSISFTNPSLTSSSSSSSELMEIVDREVFRRSSEPPRGFGATSHRSCCDRIWIAFINSRPPSELILIDRLLGPSAPDSPFVSDLLLRILGNFAPTFFTVFTHNGEVSGSAVLMDSESLKRNRRMEQNFWRLDILTQEKRTLKLMLTSLKQSNNFDF